MKRTHAWVAVAVILALSACGEHNDEFLEAPSSEVSSSGGVSSSSLAKGFSSSVVPSSSSSLAQNSSSNTQSSSSSVVPSSSSSLAQNSSSNTQSSSSSVVPSSSSSKVSSSSNAKSSSDIAQSSSSSPAQNSSSSTQSSSSSIIAIPSSSSSPPSIIAPSSSSSLAVSSSSVVYCKDFDENETRLHYERRKRQICDKRDGTKYVYVKIGTQDWLAENLRLTKDKNGKSIGKCYEHKAENCEIYGRLYVLAEALCPDGWHIPSSSELSIMLRFVDPQYQEGSELTGDGRNESGLYLKTTSGWEEAVGYGIPDNPNGTDRYGFSALPGGYCGSGCGNLEGQPEIFREIGKKTYWWTTSVGAPVPLSITWSMSGLYTVNDAMQSYPNSQFYARCVRD